MAGEPVQRYSRLSGAVAAMIVWNRPGWTGYGMANDIRRSTEIKSARKDLRLDASNRISSRREHRVTLRRQLMGALQAIENHGTSRREKTDTSTSLFGVIPRLRARKGRSGRNR